MDTKKRTGWGWLLAHAYAQPSPTYERETYRGKTITRRKQWTAPGPLFDATVVTLFLVLGIPLLFT